jgi:hypothetical protein
MKAIIQHNFTSGLGDAIVAIYEYLETAEKLKNLGFEIKLILNLTRNSYIDNSDFFQIFDKEEFFVFNNIEITEKPIYDNNFGLYKKIYTLHNVSSGLHWWDLFVDNENFDKSVITIYPQQSPLSPPKRNILNKKIHQSYLETLNRINNNPNYISIYFRTFDLNDGINFFNEKKDVVIEILKNNANVFICSNSFKIKELIKNLGFKNLFQFEIPLEKNFGNHFQTKKIIENSNETLFERTKYTLFDMISLSNSHKIFFFTEWNRNSNFLIFSKINKTKIEFL